MSFPQTLAADASLIQARLDAILRDKADQPVIHAMRYAVQGGKRLRGFLVLESARIERTLPFRHSLDETLDCGEDTGTPVSEDYVTKMPFKFTGELKQAVIKLVAAPK